jgi:hypothetical protein
MGGWIGLGSKGSGPEASHSFIPAGWLESIRLMQLDRLQGGGSLHIGVGKKKIFETGVGKILNKFEYLNR